MEREDALECVRERVRKAGGASSGKFGCATEEDKEVDKFERADVEKLFAKVQ